MSENGLDYPDFLFFNILLRIEANDLVKKCSLVCKKWNFLLNTRDFWVQKCKHDGILPPIEFRKVIIDFRQFCLKKPFGKNLIKGGIPAWKSSTNDIETDYDERWMFLSFEYEEPPVFNPEFYHPDFDSLQFTSCLATSDFWSSKDITIDLLEEGIEPKLLDELRPSIMISEFVAHRADGEAKYRMIALLLDENLKELDFFETELVFRQWQAQKWLKVDHIFHEYGPGVRYVYMRSDGKSLMGWPGPYGVKMANASVIINL